MTIPLIQCFVHRTEAASSLDGITRVGLLPGGPDCWTIENGVATRKDTPFSEDYGRRGRRGRGDQRWGHQGRGLGGGTAPAESRYLGDGPQDLRRRHVAMMSPTPNPGEFRAAGDRFDARFAIFFDVEGLLNSGHELFLAFNGAVMTTTPVPARYIVAIQDTRSRFLLFSSALSMFAMLEVADTDQEKRAYAFRVERDENEKPDINRGDIVCVCVLSYDCQTRVFVVPGMRTWSHIPTVVRSGACRSGHDGYRRRETQSGARQCRGRCGSL